MNTQQLLTDTGPLAFYSSCDIDSAGLGDLVGKKGATTGIRINRHNSTKNTSTLVLSLEGPSDFDRLINPPLAPALPPSTVVLWSARVCGVFATVAPSPVRLQL